MRSSAFCKKNALAGSCWCRLPMYFSVLIVDVPRYSETCYPPTHSMLPHSLLFEFSTLFLCTLSSRTTIVDTRIRPNDQVCATLCSDSAYYGTQYSQEVRPMVVNVFSRVRIMFSEIVLLFHKDGPKVWCVRLSKERTLAFGQVGLRGFQVL